MNRGGFGPGGGMLGNPVQQNNPNNRQKAQKLDPKTRKRVLLRLSKYLFSYYWIVIPAVILMLASNLLGIVAPKISGKAIDIISPTRNRESTSQTAGRKKFWICWRKREIAFCGTAWTVARWKHP